MGKRRGFRLRRKNESEQHWRLRLERRRNQRIKKGLKLDVKVGKILKVGVSEVKVGPILNVGVSGVKFGGVVTKQGVVEEVIDTEEEDDDESSESSGDDSQESELETDLDVDICSNSNDESDGLDVTDPNLPQQMREWRLQQKKIRSERRALLKIARSGESAEERRLRIERRNLRRRKRLALRVKRKGESLRMWVRRKNRRERRQ